MRTSFALALTAAVVLGSEIQQTPVNDSQVYETDEGFSSKLIGRISWQSTFDNWVKLRSPTGVDPDEHVCAYTFQFGQITSLESDNRDALHVSHNCHADLVQQIRFEFVMQDPGEHTLLYDKEQNWKCHTQDGTNMTCSIVLTAPKENGDGTGTDAAVWLPAAFSGDNLVWSYSYAFYEYWKTAPQASNGTTSGNSASAPEDSVNGAAAVAADDETFTTPNPDDPTTIVCQPSEVQAALIGDEVYNIDYDDYVWGCTLYEDSFVNGGFSPVGMSQVKYTRMNDEFTAYLIAVEVTVTNGLEERFTRFSPLAGFEETVSWRAQALEIYPAESSSVLAVKDLFSYWLDDVDDDVYDTGDGVSTTQPFIYNFGPEDADGYSTAQDYDICGWYYAYEKSTNRVGTFAPKICYP